MSLTDQEIELLAKAGTSGNQTVRSRACAIVLAKHGDDAETARGLLAQSYLEATSPSFHLIPRGDAMASEGAFADAYKLLADATVGFSTIDIPTLANVLTQHPSTLAPLRMIAGLTYSELAVAIRMESGEAVTANTLRTLERTDAVPTGTALERRERAAAAIASAIVAVIGRSVLEVPDALADLFHSKLEKRDTKAGWESVRADAETGVPYHALLYQRYVGGVWRQVQDAYSEIKGDAVLEIPIARLLTEARIPFFRAPSGATGARETAKRYGIEPGPDFLIPDVSPSVIIESKVGEDGGTVRDKAARIKTLGAVASTRGLHLCAVVDGKGWQERKSALADVILATSGRTFSLETLPFLLDVPEIAAHRNTAPAPTE